MAGAQATPPLQASLRLELTIGEDLGSPEYSFSRITAVGWRGSEIFVLDAGSHNLRVFGLDGRHLRTFGRQGEGPGEFLQPVHMTIDSLLHVFDAAQNRVSTFTLGGENRETRQLPAVAELNLTRILPMRGGVTVGVTTGGFAFGMPENDPYVRVVALLQNDQRVDTIARHHVGAAVWHESGEHLPWGVVNGRYGPGGAWAVSGDSLLAVVDGYSGALTVLRAEGGRMRVIRRGQLGLTGRPVVRSDLNQIERELRRSNRNLPRNIDFVTPPRWSVATRALFASDGAIWIENGTGALPGNQWTRFPRGDERPRRMILPEGFSLRLVEGNRLIGIGRTQWDSQVVQVYRWQDPPGQ